MLMLGKLLFYLEAVIFSENNTPLNSISNAKTQNFTEYFYPLYFNFNADSKKINAEIPFTPSYLELWFWLTAKRIVWLG